MRLDPAPTTALLAQAFDYVKIAASLEWSALQHNDSVQQERRDQMDCI
jgi:hypothetical protein